MSPHTFRGDEADLYPAFNSELTKSILANAPKLLVPFDAPRIGSPSGQDTIFRALA